MSSAVVKKHQRLLGIWAALWVGLVVAMVVGCAGDAPADELSGVVFQPYENTAAFEMLYPEFWSNSLISEGLILFALPDKLDLSLDEPIASMLVFRREAAQRFTLEDDHQHFLESGPLTADFQITSETTRTMLGGLEALTTTVSNPTADLPIVVQIVSTRTASGFNYTFSATAPASNWEKWQPNFQIMFGSISFNE